MQRLKDILVSIYIDVDMFNRENTTGRVHLRLEPIKFSRSVKPFDGIEPVILFQIVAAVKEYVFSTVDHLRWTLQTPHYQGIGVVQTFHRSETGKTFDFQFLNYQFNRDFE